MQRAVAEYVSEIVYKGIQQYGTSCWELAECLGVVEKSSDCFTLFSRFQALSCCK